MTKEMFCSNHAKVESLYVLAEMVLRRTENINQGDLSQVLYFKYFLHTANGRPLSMYWRVVLLLFLQVEYFLLQDDMREEKNV